MSAAEVMRAQEATASVASRRSSVPAERNAVADLPITPDWTAAAATVSFERGDASCGLPARRSALAAAAPPKILGELRHWRNGHSVTLLNSSHGVIGTSIFTSLAVLAAYAHLLVISIGYIKLVIIPVIMLAFIGAVACKFYYSSGGWQQYYDNNSEQTGFANRVKMLVALAAVTLVPQLVCSGLEKLLVGQQQQNNDSSFLISHFLFFFSSSIGALQVMMVTLRVAKVSQVLRMTFMVVLNMALHAKGAEWVGEDMVLVCMPELVAALLWFIDHFDHGGYTKCCIDKVISLKSGVIVLTAAVILVSMFATDRSIVVPTMSFRVFVSCTLAGMLSYFSMWVISGTGRDDDSAKVPIQLLKFSAFVCFAMSAVLVSMLAILHLLRLLEVTSFIDDVKAESFHPLLLCLLLNCCGMFLINAFGNHPSTGHQR